MIAESDYRRLQEEAHDRLSQAGVYVTATERSQIEIADFGLGRFEESGLALLVYINTRRCCAKELVLWPHQTCPEHRHPPIGRAMGKEETFRCRWGQVYLYVEGRRGRPIHCRPPRSPKGAYTVWQEIALGPGAQHTILPGTKHWFQAGAAGAVVSEFSTRSTDERDLFSDPRIRRVTTIG